jgi:hypothetical protein
MGRRARRRGAAEKLSAPVSEVAASDGSTLWLRGAMSAKTRAQYADVLAGAGRPAATQEDAWHRAAEFLFERLAVAWETGGVRYEEQKELLLRFRAATQEERVAIREALRAHVAEHFPEVQAP